VSSVAFLVALMVVVLLLAGLTAVLVVAVGSRRETNRVRDGRAPDVDH